MILSRKRPGRVLLALFAAAVVIGGGTSLWGNQHQVLPAQVSTSPLCDPEHCGNKLPDPGEQCDDGNVEDADGCDAFCRIECSDDGDCPSGECAGGICTNLCGNGVVDPPVCTDDGVCSQEEECDDGAQNGDEESECSSRCTLPEGDVLCPNGTVDTGEACDDGNIVNTDQCTNACQRTCTDDSACTCDESLGICIGYCGDNVMNPGEACDEGSKNKASPPADLTQWYCTAVACTRSICFDGGDNDYDQLPDADDAGCWRYDVEGARGGGDGGLVGSLIAQGSPMNPLEPEEFLPGKGDEACPTGTIDRGSFCALTCSAGEICPTGVACPADGVCPITCGNGVIDLALGEQCDDANLVQDDACTNMCRLPACTGPNCPRCGDAIHQPEIGEQCDTGGNTAACSDNCRTRCDGDDDCAGTCDLATHQCLPPVCGDGKANQEWERCDDANVNNSDACNNQCQPTCDADADCASGRCDLAAQVCVPLCGNGTIDAGEHCDDGNRNDTDQCNNLCQVRCSQGTLCPDGQLCPQSGMCPAPAICGDGLVNAGKEQCDDGNRVNADSCSNTCTIRCDQNFACPNGLLCLNEQCVPCSNSLQCNSGFCVDGRCLTALPLCGNGVVESGEVCDDANTDDADGCTARCLFPENHACVISAQCETHLCDAYVCRSCSDAGQCASGMICSEGNCLFDLSLLPFGAACGHATECTSGVCIGGVCSACRSDNDCASGLRCAVGMCLTDGQMAMLPNICGNGLREGGEACDDGNARYGDGCMPSCALGDTLSRIEVISNMAVQLPFTSATSQMHSGAGAGTGTGGDLSDTGPATVAVMAAGAAAGAAWVRRRWKVGR